MGKWKVPVELHAKQRLGGKTQQDGKTGGETKGKIDPRTQEGKSSDKNHLGKRKTECSTVTEERCAAFSHPTG